MTYIDLAAFDRAPLQRDPYDFLVLPHFILRERFADVSRDFPPVPGAGSHPPSELVIEGHFKSLMDELQGPPFRSAIETKFGIDLAGRPAMYTVRGFVSEHDGAIHTDSASKLITVLIYMNAGWEAEGGRLRILRSGVSLEDPQAEVPPDDGTLLVFRRSEISWHGHKRHVGPRRAIQLNWVTGEDVVAHEQRRHRLSSRVKRFAGAILGR